MTVENNENIKKSTDSVDEATTNYLSKLRRVMPDRRVGRGQDWLMGILWCVIFAQIGVAVLLYKTNMTLHKDHEEIDTEIAKIQAIVNDHILQHQTIKKEGINIDAGATQQPSHNSAQLP